MNIPTNTLHQTLRMVVLKNPFGLKSIKMEQDTLCCPCGCPQIHPFKTESFFRSAEDSEYGTHSTTNHNEARTDRDMKENPSPRRDGIKIYFWCEWCRKNLELQIIQHKGDTIIGWIDPNYKCDLKLETIDPKDIPQQS